MTETIKFIITPEPGDKIKVYLDKKEKVMFGTVLRIESGIDIDTGLKREVAIIKKSDVVFSTNEVDFFLTKSKVRIYES